MSDSKAALSALLVHGSRWSTFCGLALSAFLVQASQSVEAVLGLICTTGVGSQEVILHAFHTREAMLTVFRNHVTSLPKTCYPSAFLCMLSTCRNAQLRLEQGILTWSFFCSALIFWVVSMRSDCPTCVLCRFWLRVRPVCDWCQASTRTNVTRHSKTCFQAPGPIWASTCPKPLRSIWKPFCLTSEHIPNSCTSLPKTCYPSAFLCMLSTCRNTQLRLEQWIHAFRFFDTHSHRKMA